MTNMIGKRRNNKSMSILKLLLKLFPKSILKHRLRNLLLKLSSRRASETNKWRKQTTKSRDFPSLTLIPLIESTNLTELLTPSASPFLRMTSTKLSNSKRNWNPNLLLKEKLDLWSILPTFSRPVSPSSHRLLKTNTFKTKSPTWMPLKITWTTIRITKASSRISSPELRKSARTSQLSIQINGRAHLRIDITRFKKA